MRESRGPASAILPHHSVRHHFCPRRERKWSSGCIETQRSLVIDPLIATSELVVCEIYSLIRLCNQQVTVKYYCSSVKNVGWLKIQQGAVPAVSARGCSREPHLSANRTPCGGHSVRFDSCRVQGVCPLLDDERFRQDERPSLGEIYTVLVGRMRTNALAHT